MKLEIFAMAVLAVLGKTCFSAIIIETPQREKSINHLVRATTKILTSCYGNRVETIGFWGNSTGPLLETLLSNYISVILIDDKKKIAHKENSMGSRFRTKLRIFAIQANSAKQLDQILREIKFTPWWNHMASFLIINWSTESKNDCSAAREILRVAWKMNVLDATFLCVRSSNDISLFAYNPYTEIAPGPWKLWNITEKTNEHPWYMFVCEYTEYVKICDYINFDKTKDLGGYAIRSCVQYGDLYWRIDPNKTGIASFGGFEGKAAQLLLKTMNAEANLSFHDAKDSFVYADDNGKTSGAVMDVNNGTCDLILNTYYFDALTNFTISYPILEDGLGIVTQISRPMSELSKINSVMDVGSRYGLYFVMFITPVILKFLNRQKFIPAVLNTIRLICNTAMRKLPENTAGKIFLGALFSFQITILGIYQGKIASLLTKPVYQRNVDTLRDLAELGHTIYAHKSFGYVFEDPIFDGRFVGLDDYDCLKYVLRDSEAACVRDWEELRSVELNFSLHLSREMIRITSLVHAIREDWPLERRFNEIFVGAIENGLLQRIYRSNSEKISRIVRFFEKLMSQTNFRVINLTELSFAFAILGIGLALATVTFAFEILIGCGRQ